MGEDNKYYNVYCYCDGEIACPIQDSEYAKLLDQLNYTTETRDSYYYHNGVMAWDLIDEILDYHEGNLTNREAGILYNIMKYLLRFPYKGQRESDLNKAIEYIEQLKNE